MTDCVAAVEAKWKKCEEVIRGRGRGSGRGQVDEATPERIHGIRFACIRVNEKEKKGPGIMLCANNCNRFVAEPPWTAQGANLHRNV